MIWCWSIFQWQSNIWVRTRKAGNVVLSNDGMNSFESVSDGKNCCHSQQQICNGQDKDDYTEYSFDISPFILSCDVLLSKGILRKRLIRRRGEPHVFETLVKLSMYYIWFLSALRRKIIRDSN